MGRTNDGGPGAVRLRLTPLEDRTLPASGVAASLSSGLLRITDYKAADALVLHQTPTGVTVDATDTHQVYTGVSRVTVDVQNTDSVTNDVTGLAGTPPRSVYLSRRDPTGTKFIWAGNLAAGATSAVTVVTPPPPPTRDWFDLALNDAGLRSKARVAAGDGTLDRIDMLALFAQVAYDGAVSANEIHDLKTLENPDWTARGALPNQPKFAMPAPVRGLTSAVVDGDPANATYQGAPLGNIQAGASAAQFQKLVNKWFRGLDRPQAAPGTTYQKAAGNLFVNGPAVNDVRQGELSDCYFLAALSELAQDRPQAIKDMFTDNGDGTFTVRFFDGGTAKYVTVDRYLPTDSSGRLVYDGFGATASNTGNELWAALAEKAYAQLNQSGWTEQDGTNRYAGIEDGYSDTVMMQATGGVAAWTSIIRATAAQLQTAAASGKPTVLNSRPTPGNGVVANHTYPVVGYDATTQKFNLYNPQGSFIQLTWTQITQSFSGFWQLQ
ncbi:MAG TPA: C2 family cysteine protease [Gemmataceae bacterium]|jgi:hypothetical protein